MKQSTFIVLSIFERIVITYLTCLLSITPLSLASITSTPHITNALWYPQYSLLRITIMGKPLPGINIIEGEGLSMWVYLRGATTKSETISTTPPVDTIVMSAEGDTSTLQFTFTEPVKYRVYRYNLKSDEGGYLLFIKPLSEVRTGADVIEASDNAGGETEKTSKKNIPLHESADSASRIVGYLTAGDRVSILEEEGAWYRVRLKDGRDGWLKKSVVSVSVKVGDEARKAIIETAMSQLGDPYVYGGDSPGGFDCSGLVYYAYSSVGVKLPRECSKQYDECKKINLKDARPGDLIFFTTLSENPSHVGIYLGGGRFIHAESTGDGVTISSLGEQYWKERYHSVGTCLGR